MQTLLTLHLCNSLGQKIHNDTFNVLYTLLIAILLILYLKWNHINKTTGLEEMPAGTSFR